MKYLAATVLAAALIIGSVVTVESASAASSTSLPVKQGSSFVFDGSTPTHVKRTVQLQRKSGKAWKKVDSVKSASTGKFQLTVKAGKSAALYRFYAAPVKIKGKKYRAWTSKARSVKPRSTTASLSLSSGATVGSTITATVTMKKACKNQLVKLQRQDASGWTTVATARAGGSTVTLTTTATVVGTAKFRAYLAGCGGAPAVATATKLCPVAPEQPTQYTGPLAYRILGVSITSDESGVRLSSACNGNVSHYQHTVATLPAAESGPAKWIQQSRAQTGSDDTVVELQPDLDTTWTNTISGCKGVPVNTQSCLMTITEKPPIDGLAYDVLRITIAPGASTGNVLFFPDTPMLGYPGAVDDRCWVNEMYAPDSVDEWRRTIPVPTSTLLGHKPFTLESNNVQSWDHDQAGKPVDLAVNWKISYTLQRITPEGLTLEPVAR